MSNLKEHYEKIIKPELMKIFSYTNPMMVPHLEKIVINMGVGEASSDKKKVESAAQELSSIAGQKAVITLAKNSIAGFKLREKMPIGCKVTLRKKQMYEFMERLINIAMPKIKDFRGISHKSFDGRGNYAMGIKEYMIFPEINYEKIDKSRGLDIVFVTTAKTNKEALELLRGFNMPFIKE